MTKEKTVTIELTYQELQDTIGAFSGEAVAMPPPDYAGDDHLCHCRCTICRGDGHCGRKKCGQMHACKRINNIARRYMELMKTVFDSDYAFDVEDPIYFKDETGEWRANGGG